MKITKEILTQLRAEADNQRVQAMAAANAAAGQVHLLDQQLAMLAQPEPKAPKPGKASR
jgi:hypothetical protein